MVRLFDGLGYSAVLFCVLGAIQVWRRYRSLMRPGFLLLLSSGVSVAVFGFITAWLLPEANSSKSDDLRTAGLAAAAVLALYGLWLNDRRRRTEEDRGATERERLAQERERTADERFARAIELLGSDDEAVKVGGMHALASLARGWPDLVQPALDVLCAYLCMPAPESAAAPTSGARVQEVRRTAQRIVRDTLRAVEGGEAYHLDLTGAVLESFDLSGAVVGKVDLSGALCGGTTELRELKAAELVLTRTVFSGAVTADDCHIGTLSMTETRFDGRLNLAGARLKRSEAHRLTLGQGVSAERLNCLEEFTWDMRCDGPAEFAEAVFNGGLRLCGSTCRGRLGLRRAYLGPSSDLDDVRLAEADLHIMQHSSDLNPQRLSTTASEDQVLLPVWLKVVYPQSGGDGRIQRRYDTLRR
jgi:uncharacterized protein YjbI with pentapeptide repeats